MRISFYFVQTISGHSYKILLGYIGDLGLMIAHLFLTFEQHWGVYKMLYCCFFCLHPNIHCSTSNNIACPLRVWRWL